MERVFLTCVGSAYLLLAGWCALKPESTSRAVGFALQPGAGQSEYLTVYGGLQLALGLLFLAPLLRPQITISSLQACLIVHGCLVLFRSVSLLLYRGVPSTTSILAAVEWGIFLATLVLVVRQR